MRVACPSCEARYRLDPAAISLPGRNVRCMKCGTEWFVAAPGPELDPAALRALAPETSSSTSPASTSSASEIQASETPRPGEAGAAVAAGGSRPSRRRVDDAAETGPEAAADEAEREAGARADAFAGSVPDADAQDGDARDGDARDGDARDGDGAWPPRPRDLDGLPSDISEGGQADAMADPSPPADLAGEATAAFPRGPSPAEPAAPSKLRTRPGRPRGRLGGLLRRDFLRRDFLRRDDGPLRRFGARARAVALRTAAPLALAAVAVALVAFREPVVAAVPQAASLYKLAGLPVNLQGLDFTELRVRLVEDASGRALVVEGSVTNPSRVSRAVPALALALKDAAGHDLYAWTIRPPASRLEPGAREAFRSRLAAPPLQGRELVVRFVDDRDNLSRMGAAADGAGARRGGG